MKKIAVISDIHGNWEALKRVSQYLEKNIDEIWCLGDIVGYGPEPSKCIEWVKGNCKYVVCGNHDKAVWDTGELIYFNPWAQEAILWTKSKLSEEDIKFLRSLPLCVKEKEFLLVHSSPVNPEQWTYIFSLWEAKEAFQHCEEKVIFVGHTHVPSAFQFGDEEIKEIDFPININNRFRYIINPGSVGQPRDKDPRASFGILYENTFELVRIPYDIKATQKKMYEENLPIFLITRLAQGI